MLERRTFLKTVGTLSLGATVPAIPMIHKRRWKRPPRRKCLNMGTVEFEDGPNIQPMKTVVFGDNGFSFWQGNVGQYYPYRRI